MSVTIFLCHSTVDKAFARRLARDLDRQGVRFWLDEAEIKIGDSLIERLQTAIGEVDYLVAILSPDAVASPWVQRELGIATTQRIKGHGIPILPLMYRRCNLPDFLIDKRYGDFTQEEKYQVAFEELLRTIGVAFNRSAYAGHTAGANLGQAVDKAWRLLIPVLRKPFHRPFQYIGMAVDAAARDVGAPANAVGNIIVESEECRMLLEAEGAFINYVDVELKFTGPHKQADKFDSEALLGAVSINPAELELVRKQVHYHAYYDHSRKLKIGVACQYDGAPISIGFSKKYYGM